MSNVSRMRRGREHVISVGCFSPCLDKLRLIEKECRYVLSYTCGHTLYFIVKSTVKLSLISISATDFAFFLLEEAVALPFLNVQIYDGGEEVIW